MISQEKIEKLANDYANRYYLNSIEISKDSFLSGAEAGQKELNENLKVENDNLKKEIQKIKETLAKLCQLCKADFDYKLIDLGLPSGALWMDRNIGASVPTDFGLYFAWGETQGYADDEVGETKQFCWKDYKYANGVYYKLTKYCDDSEYGNNIYTDSLSTLQMTDDAAYQFTNGKCSMPTKEQIQELVDNTTYEWTTMGGVKGGLFTSKTNGNSIFIPAAGVYEYGSVDNVGEYGGLWSNSLYGGYPNNAWGLYFDSGVVDCGYNQRFFGFPVRGVIK